MSIVTNLMNPMNADKHIEKMLDGNYFRILRAVLNKFWKQHIIKQLQSGHFPRI